jgi:selenocysteine lyase/cysteine desulfurase
VVGLGAALELFLKTGLAEIESYVLGLSDYLSEQLQARGYRVVSSRRAGETSAIVCCQHERHSAEQLYELLNERQIVTTPRLGRLRISPHFYNTRAELDQLLAALPD